MMKTIALALAFAATSAHAGMFKCTNAQGAVEFSDKPCVGASAVEAVKIQENRISGPAYRSGSPNTDQLTTLVVKAIANKDYRKARELAVTAQHWALIADGERLDAQVRAEEAKARAARRPVICNSVGSGNAINLGGGYTIGSSQSTTYCN